jgi:signal transduction histidine kinase
MKIFYWDNLIVVGLGILLGVFTGLGVRQSNIIESGLGFGVVLASLVLLGFTSGLLLIFKKALTRREYEIEVLKTTDESRNQFISMLLHFIRTPLSGIRWSLKSILQEELEKRRKGELQKLFEADGEALEAVEHLLDVSRASLGRIQYTFTLVKAEEVKKIIEDGVEQFRSQIEDKGLSLVTNLSSLSDKTVRIDKEKISLAFQTIVQNAISYTDTGSIVVSVEEKAREILVSVKDTGMGIPGKAKPFIFSQFYRAENARRKIPGGFGVGLYLARIFIKTQGGELWFTSDKPKGTTFTFSLPLTIGRGEEFIQKISG